MMLLTRHKLRLLVRKECDMETKRTCMCVSTHSACKEQEQMSGKGQARSKC